MQEHTYARTLYPRTHARSHTHERSLGNKKQKWQLQKPGAEVGFVVGYDSVSSHYAAGGAAGPTNVCVCVCVS